MTHDDLGEDTIVLSLNIHGGLVGLLQSSKDKRSAKKLEKACYQILMIHTISRSTSPALKASPGCFFQAAIPPSVMVGLMAGMLNLEKASALRDEEKAVRSRRQGIYGEIGCFHVKEHAWIRTSLSKGQTGSGAGRGGGHGGLVDASALESTEGLHRCKLDGGEE